MCRFAVRLKWSHANGKHIFRFETVAAEFCIIKIHRWMRKSVSDLADLKPCHFAAEDNQFVCTPTNWSRKNSNGIQTMAHHLYYYDFVNGLLLQLLLLVVFCWWSSLLFAVCLSLDRPLWYFLKLLQTMWHSPIYIYTIHTDWPV